LLADIGVLLSELEHGHLLRPHVDVVIGTFPVWTGLLNAAGLLCASQWHMLPQLLALQSTSAGCVRIDMLPVVSSATKGAALFSRHKDAVAAHADAIVGRFLPAGGSVVIVAGGHGRRAVNAAALRLDAAADRVDLLDYADVAAIRPTAAGGVLRSPNVFLGQLHHQCALPQYCGSNIRASLETDAITVAVQAFRGVGAANLSNLSATGLLVHLTVGAVISAGDKGLLMVARNTAKMARRQAK
jgi:hypothetical protein